MGQRLSHRQKVLLHLFVGLLIGGSLGFGVSLYYQPSNQELRREVGTEVQNRCNAWWKEQMMLISEEVKRRCQCQ